MKSGVIPAKAGIQGAQKASCLDPRLRGDDTCLNTAKGNVLRYNIVSKILSIALLSSCSSWVSTDTTKLPELETPTQWKEASEESNAFQGSAWLKAFGSIELEALVAEALKANHDLKIAATRVTLAQARAELAGVETLPSFSVDLDGTRTFRNKSDTQTSAVASNRFGLGVSISWEADLWGSLSHQEKAATLEYQSSQWSQQAVRFALAANVVRLWYSVVAAQSQQQLIQRRIENLKKGVIIIEERFQDGISTALDVHLARAGVASEEHRLLQQTSATTSTIRQLEVVLGRYPRGVLHVSESTLSISLDSVPPGLPSELLKRRPDLLALQHRFFAADERIQVAYKNRFPSLRLTGSLGGSSEEFNELFDPDSMLGSLFAGLSAPIFYGDQLEAMEQQARAQAEELAFEYTQTLLTAFQEVEEALKAEQSLVKQIAVITEAVTTYHSAETLALEQYQSGLTDLTTVLDAERRAFDAQRTLIELQHQRIQNRINLYLALGGDFEDS